MKEVKPPKKPLLYYYGIILVVILILNSFYFPAIFQKQVKEVDYGTFLTMVEEGKCKKLKLKIIIFYLILTAPVKRILISGQEQSMIRN